MCCALPLSEWTFPRTPLRLCVECHFRNRPLMNASTQAPGFSVYSSTQKKPRANTPGPTCSGCRKIRKGTGAMGTKCYTPGNLMAGALFFCLFPGAFTRSFEKNGARALLVRRWRGAVLWLAALPNRQSATGPSSCIVSTLGAGNLSAP